MRTRAQHDTTKVQSSPNALNTMYDEDNVGNAATQQVTALKV